MKIRKGALLTLGKIVYTIQGPFYDAYGVGEFFLERLNAQNNVT